MGGTTSQRLVIVKLSSLGDIVHALPLAESLRVGLGPDAFIGWAVQRKFLSLLEGNPNLSALYPLDSKRLPEVFGLGKRLRAERFDTALDPQGLLISGLLTRLTGARRRIGNDLNREGNRHFLTETVPAPKRRHVVQKLLDFCVPLGIPPLAPRRQHYLADAEATTAETLLAPSGSGPRVALIIGASTPVKSYPVERWRELIVALDAAGSRVVLVGGPGETALGGQLCQSTGVVAADLTGKTTPRVLAAVLARCSVAVGGDTGPTHIAAAVGTPTVGLFGVSDPAHSATNWGAGGGVVLDFAEDASPPEQRHFRHPTLTDALARIPVGAVTEAVVALQKDSGGPA